MPTGHPAVPEEAEEDPHGGADPRAAGGAPHAGGRGGGAPGMGEPAPEDAAMEDPTIARGRRRRSHRRPDRQAARQHRRHARHRLQLRRQGREPQARDRDDRCPRHRALQGPRFRQRRRLSADGDQGRRDLLRHAVRARSEERHPRAPPRLSGHERRRPGAHRLAVDGLRRGEGRPHPDPAGLQDLQLRQERVGPRARHDRRAARDVHRLRHPARHDRRRRRRRPEEGREDPRHVLARPARRRVQVAAAVHRRLRGEGRRRDAPASRRCTRHRPRREGHEAWRSRASSRPSRRRTAWASARSSPRSSSAARIRR